MIASVDAPAQPPERRFVSRAGLKLDHALNEFNIDVTGLTCADFGCNVGGFTDCLLQRGAAKVYAIDTGYNVLAYTLRVDPRVIVLERTNALHAAPPDDRVDLVVVDLAWTPQRHAIPAATRWLAGQPGRIITLVKPHYELDEQEKETLLIGGRLDPAEAERVLKRVLEEMPSWGAAPLQWTTSPITGGKSSKRAKKMPALATLTGGKTASGNVEYLVLAKPIGASKREPEGV